MPVLVDHVRILEAFNPCLLVKPSVTQSQPFFSSRPSVVVVQDDERLKFAIVGAFQPSFVQGNGWDGWLQSTYRPQVALPTLVCRSNATWLEFPGEINTQNKNKGKINNCGFDPMRTEKRCWAVDVMAEVLTFHELCGR